jgi:hypothetical protein
MERDEVVQRLDEGATALEMAAAAEELGHPMGRRKADAYLARAVVRSLGRIPSRPQDASLSEGLRAVGIGVKPSGWSLAIAKLLHGLRLRSATVPPRTSRRWYLRRLEQQDQGPTPHCVAFTQKHWELAVPTITRAGLPTAEMYGRAKQRDGWPGADGTSASAMLEVCQELGIVHSHWWWTGPSDDEAARRWLLDVGPLWFGAGWSESMFRTDQYGLVTVEGPLEYGHETLVIGRTPNFRRLGPAVEIVNSWGLDNWGVMGRGWILEKDFFGRLMPEGGDLVGVVEQRA